jgi:hypothetical protein
MTALGRPRKNGPREPNGRICRASKNAVIAVHRDLGIIRRERLNPLLGTPIGLLLREGKITELQFAAADRFKALRKAADGVLTLPGRTPPAMDMNAAKGRAIAFERDPEKDARTMKRLRAAEQALGDKRPGGMWWCIDQMVVHEIPLATYADFLTLRAALEKLVELWGLRT